MRCVTVYKTPTYCIMMTRNDYSFLFPLYLKLITYRITRIFSNIRDVVGWPLPKNKEKKEKLIEAI